ncbi:MAG: RiPP maturation radical SAM C-methyltransferase [Eubacteriales bacterium]
MYILYVVPPFYELSNPAIGISNLCTLTEKMGYETKIFYENIRLLEDLPLPVYHFIANNQASMTLMLGDFIYALLRIPESEIKETIDSYLKNVVAEFLLDHPRVINAYRKFIIKMISIVQQAGSRTVTRILAEKPDIIGFTIGAYQLNASLYLAQRIKEIASDKMIWFGGSYCTGEVGYQLLKYFPCIDVVFTGEAEKPLEAVLKNMKNGNFPTDVNGVLTRNIGSKCHLEKLCPQLEDDLDELPVPDYSYYVETLKEVPEARAIKPYLLMETSRGCWWAQKSPCNFCGLNMQTKKFRTKSARRILEELSEYMKKYGITQFAMVDNVLNRDFFRVLFPEVKAKFEDIKLFYEVRCNLSREELVILHDAGVNFIQAGVEAVDNELLDLMHKGTNSCQNLQVIKWCEELDVYIAYNFLYAIPGESREAYRRVIALTKNIHHLRPPRAARIHLDRGSSYDLESERFGIVRTGVPPAVTYCFPEKHIDPLLIVHSFSSEIRNQDPSLPIMWAEFVDEIEAWRKDYYKNCRILSYKMDDGQVLIHDSRFSEMQCYELSKAESAVFMYCDFGCSREMIRENIKPFSTEEINKALDQLCEKKIVYFLNGKYISLAVKEKEKQGQEIPARSRENFKNESYPEFKEIPEISKDFPWIYENTGKLFGINYRHKQLVNFEKRRKK